MSDTYPDVPLVDTGFVRVLAAANGLELTAERAADLAPAVQSILDADAQLQRLDLRLYPVAGQPWDCVRPE